MRDFSGKAVASCAKRPALRILSRSCTSSYRHHLLFEKSSRLFTRELTPMLLKLKCVCPFIPDNPSPFFPPLFKCAVHTPGSLSQVCCPYPGQPIFSSSVLVYSSRTSPALFYFILPVHSGQPLFIPVCCLSIPGSPPHVTNFVTRYRPGTSTLPRGPVPHLKRSRHGSPWVAGGAGQGLEKGAR